MELKLGLNLPAIQDKRDIKLKSILVPAKLPPLPESFWVDTDVGGVVDERMFSNDQYGDCVIADQAHFIFRLEKFEQGKQIDITDKEVIDEYFRQSGGRDTGLYMHSATKEWRTHGLIAGEKPYTIHAFVKANTADMTELKYCIYLLRGFSAGVMIFQKDIDQFNAGMPWSLTESNGNYLGGHAIYVNAYDSILPSQEIVMMKENRVVEYFPSDWGCIVVPDQVESLTYKDRGDYGCCMTWGKTQAFTWDWWKARAQEAYAIVDEKNKWMGANSPLDVEAMEKQLQEVTGETPNNSVCPLCKIVRKMLA